VDSYFHGNYRGCVQICEDVSANEDNSGIELAEELAKDCAEQGAKEEAGDMDHMPQIHAPPHWSRSRLRMRTHPPDRHTNRKLIY
jgi:hypothetical protein